MTRPARSNTVGLCEASRTGGGFSLLVLCTLAGACRSVTERELALSFSARGSPGAGAGVELSQRLLEHAGARYDFELGLERQNLPDEGPRGDAWTRIWAGFGCARSESLSGPTAHAGVTWLRSEAPTDELEEFGDYGGGYLDVGWLFALGPALATGPDLEALYVDAEGNRGGSGAVVEVAWRLVWWL